MRRLLVIASSIATLACQGNGMTGQGAVPGSAGDVPEATLRKLAQKRIYFGHQSVGYNIVEGVESFAREFPGAGLRVVEARTEDAFASPVFAHAKNGRNHEPLVKVEDFAETLDRGGLGNTTDIALFKLCYVDLPPGTDVDALFSTYKSTMARLRHAFPRVRFVHVTSPLTVVQSGPKALVKRLLGKPVGGAEANVVRERFNALMRKEYAGREPVFDLAAAESTLPDGRTVTFEFEGKSYPALAAEYASDGKHLNPVGSRWVASRLLQALATAAD